MAALVSVGGEVVFERYLGGADLEHGIPVSAATRFHIASVSKQFTALAALLEAENGRVDLEADVHDYLPELADYGAKVTLCDLVHHTGGLRDQWDLMMLSGTPLDGLIRQSAIVAMAARQRELNFPPGTDFRYSNTGYSLLAEIVARTSGMPFARYLGEAVLAPLGMSETLVYGDASRLLPGRAMSYRLDREGEVRLVRLNYSNYGATSLHSTPHDLAKWAHELLHPNVFRPELIAKMLTPGTLKDGTPLNYGFGIMRDMLAGRPALTHGGADAGYRAAFDCFPDDDASVIVFSNGQADVSAIARALADAFLSPAPPAPDLSAPDEATLAGLAGHYLSGWGPGLTLQVADGKLMMGAAGPVEAKFLPSGEFYFFAPTLRFSPTPGGDLAEQGVGGLELLHRRTERKKPTAADIAALAGRYHSDEIDSTYHLAAYDTGLTLSSLRFPPLNLTPADLDAFDGPMMRLTVLRNDAGAPVGFMVSTGRVRGLTFRKID
ncbi:MAG TPA: serine hydrolase domain-containing protein [Caulobacteraceae bacterium]|nr:serine hydrolase domain-containing protein [Caulobacteraceae bacterium]